MKIKNKPLFYILIPVIFLQIFFTIPDSTFFFFIQYSPLAAVIVLIFDLTILTMLIILFKTTINNEVKTK